METYIEMQKQNKNKSVNKLFKLYWKYMKNKEMSYKPLKINVHILFKKKLFRLEIKVSDFL